MKTNELQWVPTPTWAGRRWVLYNGGEAHPVGRIVDLNPSGIEACLFGRDSDRDQGGFKTLRDAAVWVLRESGLVTDFRTRVCLSILSEGAFDMTTYFPEVDFPENSKLGCGTACCIAGHIVAQEKGVPMLNAMWPFAIPGVAKSIWASHFSEDEARRLQFNSGWGSKLEDVTAEEAVAHVRGLPTVEHGY